MHSPGIVSRQQWRQQRAALLIKEKAMTGALDALAAERRRLGWERIDKDYVFDSPSGRLGFAELFNGRGQLIVYHHMLKPADEHPCPGCCLFTDQVSHLAHLHARDTSFVLVSRAPIAEIENFKRRMGWTIPWYSTVDDFNGDFDVASGFGLNVFLRRPDGLFRTYFTSGRGIEMLGSVWTFLDLTPLGRQENWEDSPDSVERSAPYRWWRLHDEYVPRGAA